MRSVSLLLLCVSGFPSLILAAEPLPFNTKVEVFRQKETDVAAFAVRLEQPFLAEEFEKSNYLRLNPLDQNSYLIYPKETKFEKKHAEFYGRLRGEGTAKLRLSYEIVSENLDGSRQVEVRQADIEVKIPAEPTGIEAIYKEWARRQNDHFAELLKYYPDESFFEYVLLQSQDRYGVAPATIPQPPQTELQNETDLYHIFSGGLAVQQSLQRQTLGSGPQVGDLNIHISRLSPPQFQTFDYKTLLEKKAAQGIQPQVHAMAELVPEDQYFLHFRSIETANELMDLSMKWGENLLRLFRVSARDNHLREKYEDQLCIRRDALAKLFADAVISEMAITGSDFFIAEGSDLTLVFQLKQPDVFQTAADGWLAQVREKYPEIVERSFNYRGYKVAARYTSDRMVSSFVVTMGDYTIYSNSHVAIRKMIDTIIGDVPNLHDSLDYRYVTTILPPLADPQSAFLYGSEAFLKRLVSPAFKIAEKRRLQSFNNLVMLNNASMFYRLEYGRSPSSLSDLLEGKFVNPSKVVDPTGGAYAYDVERDTATSSLYNRIKYLTPIVELDVLNVSEQEQQEYERYKQRYEAFWKQVFDPLAVRMTVGERVKLETCVLPFANSSLYSDLRNWLDEKPQMIETANIARSAVSSLVLAPGRERIAEILRAIPGMTEALAADPTLIDLSWLGDRVSLHFLDEDTILEIDPTRLQSLSMFGEISIPQQAIVSSALAATNLPIYMTVDVEDEVKASRLLEHLSSRIFLEGDNLLNLPARFDAYRLPDYKQHKIYVLSYQWYALTLRLHVALVKGRLVAATKPDALREVIDAAENEPARDPYQAHALLRVNFTAMDKMKDDLQLYWSEKLRKAAHRNIMPIYNLIKLYDVPIEKVNALADAKYGVTYFCPGGGEYKYDAESDQVYSTAYGNRQNAKQPLTINDDSAFSEFINSLDELVATLRFEDEALIGTVEITRKRDQPADR